MTDSRDRVRQAFTVMAAAVIVALLVSPSAAFVAANAEELQRVVNEAHSQFKGVMAGVGLQGSKITKVDK